MRKKIKQMTVIYTDGTREHFAGKGSLLTVKVESLEGSITAHPVTYVTATVVDGD